MSLDGRPSRRTDADVFVSASSLPMSMMGMFSTFTIMVVVPDGRSVSTCAQPDRLFVLMRMTEVPIDHSLTCTSRLSAEPSSISGSASSARNDGAGLGSAFEYE